MKIIFSCSDDDMYILHMEEAMLPHLQQPTEIKHIQDNNVELVVMLQCTDMDYSSFSFISTEHIYKNRTDKCYISKHNMDVMQK